MEVSTLHHQFIHTEWKLFELKIQLQTEQPHGTTFVLCITNNKCKFSYNKCI